MKFITGEKSLSEWDAYVAELNNMPVEDLSLIHISAPGAFPETGKRRAFAVISAWRGIEWA